MSCETSLKLFILSSYNPAGAVVAVSSAMGIFSNQCIFAWVVFCFDLISFKRIINFKNEFGPLFSSLYFQLVQIWGPLKTVLKQSQGMLSLRAIYVWSKSFDILHTVEGRLRTSKAYTRIHSTICSFKYLAITAERNAISIIMLWHHDVVCAVSRSLRFIDFIKCRYTRFTCITLRTFYLYASIMLNQIIKIM